MIPSATPAPLGHANKGNTSIVIVREADTESVALRSSGGAATDPPISPADRKALHIIFYPIIFPVDI